MKFRTILVSFVILSIVSCVGQKTEWQGTIEVVDGVTVVKNPKKPMYEKDVFTIEEDLKIGESVRDENYKFSYISSLDVDKEENIYVADTKEMHIKVFDKMGKFLRVIGKEGQGPDETSMLRNIKITPKNELLVFDVRNRKIPYFSLEGKFLKPIDTGKLKILRLYCDSHDNYYVVTGSAAPPDPYYELLKLDRCYAGLCHAWRPDQYFRGQACEAELRGRE